MAAIKSKDASPDFVLDMKTLVVSAEMQPPEDAKKVFTAHKAQPNSLFFFHPSLLTH